MTGNEFDTKGTYGNGVASAKFTVMVRSSTASTEVTPS
jgi:hypothetical protein